MTPRIDPLKLLTCLKVLLAPNGGINSENEVKRLAGLMAKYSKKLVSKCIYIQILKCTKTDLLGAFMGSGGWSLTHMWLSDGIRTLNWPLVQEILELLLLCPVDIQRLRSNSAPKLVKGLSKDGGNEGVRILASKLVEQWLKVVKGETTSINATLPNVAAAGTDIKSNTTTGDQNKSHLATYGLDNNTNSLSNVPQSTHTNSASDQDPLALTSSLSSSNPAVLQSPPVAERVGGDSALVYKFILKDGKQVLAKIDSGSTAERNSSAEITSEDRTSSPHTINQEEKDEDSKTSSEGSKSDKSNIKDSEKDKNKETESKLKDSKDKDKEKSRSSKDKDKHRDHKSSSSSHKSSSSSKSSSKSSSSSKSKSSSSSSRKLSTDSRSKDKEREKDRDSEKDKSKSDKEKHKSSSKSSGNSSSSSSSSKDKHRDRDRDRSSKDKDKEKEKEKEKDKSKDKDKEKEKEKEKEKIKDKDDKDKSEQSDGEKPALPSIDKLGKIPKMKKDDGSSSPSATPTSITIPSKKASMSIEIRRDTERPKTVKTYKSQFRSHGLTDEAPPPPSRKGLKKPVSQSIPGTAIFSTISFKRPSPPPQPVTSPATTASKELEPPAEKKLKIDLNPPPSNPANEKPGAIKLIAPKAKPSTLIESDMFMDALSASAMPKKDSKKRKRRASGSKDKENTTTSPPESPVAAKAAPLKFYQDTLEDKEDDKSDNLDETKEDDKKDDDDKKEDEDDIPLKRVKEQIEEEVRQEKEGGNGKSKDDSTEELDDEPVVKKPPGPGCGPDGPPGVLMFHRRKGPKKKLTWKAEEELESIRYFELDETERVNVTKTFNEMKNMDRFNEREAFLLARKLNCEDIMAEQTHWMPLILVDDVPPHPEGSQSKEKKIQAEREQTTLKALYFNRHMIPDSPSEPDMEQYQITEPAVIPLDDITGNPDAVNDFTNMPWPDPKGSPPHNVPDDFLGGPDMGFPSGQFNPFMQFGQPGWMGPGNGPPGPPNGVMPPNIMGGPPMGPPPMSGPVMGPPMGGFNNMNMGPGPQNMGGVPPPPSLLMGPPEPDDIGLMKNMNMIPPFGGPGPNFMGPGPNQSGFNNFGPPNMPNMGMSPNPNMNMNRGMDNGPNNRNMNNSNRGSWRSGSAGPPPRDPGVGNWRPQGPSNNRNWAHGNNNSRICKAFQRGFCRNGNKCTYMHPPANY